MPYGCILCGFTIPSSASHVAEPWASEYRAIYSHPLGHSVTGVGCHDGSASWSPPSDPTQRWDDQSNNPVQELSVMQQSPLDGRHGFVLHEACWMLLCKAWGPRTIRLDRLVAMCEALPFPLRTIGLGWPHAYGGLLLLETQDHFPWEEALSMPREVTPIFSNATANPYDVPDISTILSSCAKPQPERGLSKTARDCFSRLAWELREAIAVLLTTTDALALRQASASFLPLLSSSAFWASRFARERNFVFEAHGRREMTDWLELYRLTDPKHGPPSLQNRCRIWHIIKSVIEIAKLDYNEHLLPTTEHPLASPWSSISGNIQFDKLEDDWRPFDEGCCSMRTVVVAVPNDLLRIGVSVIDLGPTSYVTGFRFITRSTPDVCIGYTTSSETLFTTYELHGFKVAVAPSGLRAVQVVGEDRSLSEWIACPDDIPVSERLIRLQPIKVITVKLDGFKIVGLGVTALSESLGQDLRANDLPLRESALWYPRTPLNELYLNESSFTGQHPCHTDYRPLIWNHFGGQRGSNLQHVVGLSVQNSHHLHSLEIIYDGVYNGCSSSKLGRCNPRDVPPGPIFTIDGVGGELITSVAVHLTKDDHPRAYDFLRHGVINCLKITTNRGREFQSNAGCDHLEAHTLKIAEGTTITGFYTSLHPDYGLISLGVISELL